MLAVGQLVSTDGEWASTLFGRLAFVSGVPVIVDALQVITTEPKQKSIVTVQAIQKISIERVTFMTDRLNIVRFHCTRSLMDNKSPFWSKLVIVELRVY